MWCVRTLRGRLLYTTIITSSWRKERYFGKGERSFKYKNELFSAQGKKKSTWWLFFRLMDVTWEAAGCPPYLSQRYQDRHVYKPKRCVQICVNIIIFPVNLSNPHNKKEYRQQKKEKKFLFRQRKFIVARNYTLCVYCVRWYFYIWLKFTHVSLYFYSLEGLCVESEDSVNKLCPITLSSIITVID